MCFGGGSGNAPEVRQSSAPQQNNENVIMTANNTRQRQAAALAAGNSRLTGPLGDTSIAPTTNKTLLG